MEERRRILSVDIDYSSESEEEPFPEGLHEFQMHMDPICAKLDDLSCFVCKLDDPGKIIRNCPQCNRFFHNSCSYGHIDVSHIASALSWCHECSKSFDLDHSHSSRSNKREIDSKGNYHPKLPRSKPGRWDYLSTSSEGSSSATEELTNVEAVNAKCQSKVTKREPKSTFPTTYAASSNTYHQPKWNISEKYAKMLNKSKNKHFKHQTCHYHLCDKIVEVIDSIFCGNDCIERYVNHVRRKYVNQSKSFMLLDSKHGNILNETLAPRSDQLLEFLRAFPTHYVIPSRDALHEKLRKDLQRKSTKKKQKLNEKQMAVEENINPSRVKIRDQMATILNRRILGDSELYSNHRDVLRVVVNLETALWRLFGCETSVPYMAKARLIITHLKFSDNKSFYREVLSGNIPPERIVTMTSEQMSARGIERSRQREAGVLSQSDAMLTNRMGGSDGGGETGTGAFCTSSHPLKGNGDLGTVATDQTHLQNFSATFDTTSMHDSHLYDVNCRLCTTSKENEPSEAEQKIIDELLRLGERSAQLNESSASINDLDNIDKMDNVVDPEEKVQPYEPSSIHADNDISFNDYDDDGQFDSLLDSLPDSLPMCSSQSKGDAINKSPLLMTPFNEDAVDGDKERRQRRVTFGGVETKSIATNWDCKFEDQSEERKIQWNARNCLQWRGEFALKDLGRLECNGYPVSGELQRQLHSPVELSLDVPQNIEIVGRSSVQVVLKYLQALKNSSKVVIVMRLKPLEERSSREMFESFFNYFFSRERIGVCGGLPDHVKDIFLLPLHSQAPIPSEILPFRGPGLNDNRSHCLLLIIIRTRSETLQRQPFQYSVGSHDSKLEGLQERLQTSDKAVLPLPILRKRPSPNGLFEDEHGQQRKRVLLDAPTEPPPGRVDYAEASPSTDNDLQMKSPTVVHSAETTAPPKKLSQIPGTKELFRKLVNLAAENLGVKPEPSTDRCTAINGEFAKPSTAGTISHKTVEPFPFLDPSERQAEDMNDLSDLFSAQDRDWRVQPTKVLLPRFPTTTTATTTTTAASASSSSSTTASAPVQLKELASTASDATNLSVRSAVKSQTQNWFEYFDPGTLQPSGGGGGRPSQDSADRIVDGRESDASSTQNFSVFNPTGVAAPSSQRPLIFTYPQQAGATAEDAPKSGRLDAPLLPTPLPDAGGAQRSSVNPSSMLGGPGAVHLPGALLPLPMRSMRHRERLGAPPLVEQPSPFYPSQRGSQQLRSLAPPSSFSLNGFLLRRQAAPAAASADPLQMRPKAPASAEYPSELGARARISSAAKKGGFPS